MKNITKQANQRGLSNYLSPLGAWALAFGCSIGWGSFVMPGTTFLPLAGPLGTVIGLLIGALIMTVISLNYRLLMSRYRDCGGTYTYTSRVLGSDHGFLCAWMLILTYAAIIWANSNALSLILRYISGNIFRFGFSYQVFGYTVYFGEVLLSVSVLLLTGLLCAFFKKIASYIQITFSLLMFLLICIAFTSVVIYRNGFSDLKPAFSPDNSRVMQIFAIIILAPWAFIGFESISHSAQEFKFPVKKTLPIMIFSLFIGVLAYIMLTLCAALAVPDGFGSWTEYIDSLSTLGDLRTLPTFYAAKQAMGKNGLLLLGAAAFFSIATGLIGNYIALSRLLHRLSYDGMMPKKLKNLTRSGVPYAAVFFIMIISCIIPLLGRTALGWIVDVTTVGATTVYTYTSITAFAVGKRENKVSFMICGLTGTAISLTFVVFYLFPSIWKYNTLSSESYLILIVWSILGMTLFRFIMKHDKSRSLGKSSIVWVVLLLLIVLISVIWIRQSMITQADDIIKRIRVVFIHQAEQAGLSRDNDIVKTTGSYITERIFEFVDIFKKEILVLAALIMCSLAIIFSIFSIIKKREKNIENERLLAEENSRAKSAFFSSMSHDLRTPMNAITGYTALALKEEDIPDTVRDYLQKIDDSSHHLLSLINDVLDMSRIESGKIELITEPSDLFDIMDDVHQIFAVQMKGKNISFMVDYSEVENRYVICDKNRLNRILLNLISNAYKYTPEGGNVSVILKETGKDEKKCFYEFSVIDDGIGMSEEFSKHIFDAFEREQNKTVDNIQGTGLGMAITKKLTDLMNGEITVKTQKGQGSCFILDLSFLKAEQEDIEKAIKAEEKTKHDFTGRKLLLVEDNPINTEIACLMLGDEGFQIDTAENGQIAVDMLKNKGADTYDAVLMDIQMPIMNGYEASREIRSLGDKYMNIPIIALSANTFASDIKEAAEAGMNAHVSKPYNPDELFAVLAEYID